jgi:uncharacterized protein (DUF433 family)
VASVRDVIVKGPKILLGAPVFRGARVPLQAIFDAIEAGDTVHDFFEGFPGVTREIGVAAREEAQALLSRKV